MLQTIPTTLPKLNSNFSIDWLVKGDKNVAKEKHVEKVVPITTPVTPISPAESLSKEYDREISTALRLSSPSATSDINANIKCDKTTAPVTPPNKIDSKVPIYDGYTSVSPPTDPSHFIPPMPFIPHAAAPADSKLNYFDKSIDASLAHHHHNHLHNHHHQSHQQQQQPTMPLTPPQNVLPLDAMQQHQQFLSAQLQMAAALNYQRHASGQPQALNFSQIFSNNFHRTSYQLQPWLLNRHGRFPYGYAGADFLLHPYRKPKRIRTAFAPLQLLELENAFEGNQYVVGSERKALAKTLNLTETQVKVWFQNRRTKHKRMQQEGGNNMNNRSLSDDDESNNCMDDEEIDIEDTDNSDEHH